ncbi:hypothetical protein DY000_02059161 [Brassica cretica]|uniref:Ubiquitin thioesterase OTU n=1 Tax=Brassica cretica TaxID=69181 RepID=A0ABQ7ASE1_BRACR|nr:hypothetical protein DY000_02059161 [Brassica cretica]
MAFCDSSPRRRSVIDFDCKEAVTVYETLEHRLVVAEAAQKLRLPLISDDGEIHEEEIEKWSMLSRSSLDSATTSFTISSASNSVNYPNSSANSVAFGAADTDGVGGVPNRFLGITPAYLSYVQLQNTMSMDMADYQMFLAREIEGRLKDKCDKLADAIVDDTDSSTGNQNSSARLPERVKFIIEEIEREEAALREDLYSADRKFSEYYNFEIVIMEGIIVRRVIPSDNSCLFNAIGYVMDKDKKKAPELRQVIAAAVASDKEKYNEAFLGKPNEEYCTWILNPEKWGGAIELSILADYYGREIGAYDIQTSRCDLYGQLSPFEDAEEDFDMTIFPVGKDRSIGSIEGLVLNLVKDQQRKRSYTDTANFTLRCGVCQIGVIGQKEAVEHAQATGHVNFQEYH